MIPKIIHYCWLSGEDYPENIKNNIASWKVILPDYEFILWDRKRFDLPKSVWIQQALENNKFAFASDFIRLHAVYTYGGIYLDADIEILKSFDDLLHLPYFIGKQHNKLMEAAAFGAEKKADWLLISMQHYVNRSFVKENGNFDMVVLPRVMKLQIEKVKNITLMDATEVQEAARLLKNEASFYLFPFEYFSAKNFETGKITRTKNTYTIHHFSSSWLPFFSKIRRKTVRFIGVGQTEKLISFLSLRKLLVAIKAI
tara:strand:- start:52 stop:819 length:768 start_codon:yes stop_codon:yes gene_type:complete